MKVERFFTHPFGMMGSAILATILWGSAFPFIKKSYGLLDISSKEMGEQLLFAGYRFMLASVLIFLFMRLIGQSWKLKPSTIVPLCKISLFQTLLQYILFYWGMGLSTGTAGSIIAGTTSFFQILFAHYMYRDEKLNLRNIFGLIVGFMGVIFANLQEETFQFSMGVGEIVLLVAMMMSALGNLLARNGAATMNIFYLTAYQMLFGSIGLILMGVVQVGWLPFHFEWISLFMLFYLAVVSAAGFILWNNVMKYNKVGKVSMFLFFIPVSGVCLSSIMLHEAFHIYILLALFLVTSGIMIVNRGGKEKDLKLTQQMKTDITRNA